jgi:hypothetical protein
MTYGWRGAGASLSALPSEPSACSAMPHGVPGFVLASAAESNAQPTSIPAGARGRIAFARNNPEDSRSPLPQGTLLAADDTAFVIIPRRAGWTPRLIRVAPNVRLERHTGTRGTNLRRGALAGLIARSVINNALARVAASDPAGTIGAAAAELTPRHRWSRPRMPNGEWRAAEWSRKTRVRDSGTGAADFPWRKYAPSFIRSGVQCGLRSRL